MEEEKKYKLTDEIIDFEGCKLHRIEALKDFSNVKKGDKGGFVESEYNLSQMDNCWVYDDARVYGCGVVRANAIICGNAEVYDDARVYGGGAVRNNAIICGNAEVFGSAAVFGYTKVFGNAKVYDNTVVSGNAKVYGNAEVCGHAKVVDNAEVLDNAKVFDCVRVSGKALVRGNAIVASNSDYIIFKNWWSSGRYFTWTRSNNMWSVGCFYGTGEELITKAYKDSELSGREYERVVKYVESILKDSEK